MFVVCGEACSTCSRPATHPPAWRWMPTHRRLAVQRGAGPGAAGSNRWPSSRVSSGFLGERLMRTLREEGIDTAPCSARRPTTLSLIGVDAARRAGPLLLRRRLRRPALDADALVSCPTA